MGLDSFETEGHLTYSTQETQSKQQDSKRKPVGAEEFEEEWDITMHEAEEDDEFVAQRIAEASSMTEVCQMFHWIPHTIISRAAQLVDEGLLDPNNIPQSEHPDYNDKDIGFYIEQYNKNNTITSRTTTSTTSSSNTTNTSSNDSDDGFSSGLGNFTS